ncbi:hypothetical protein CMO83_05380 [Candidatus Woesearchaeota archaeon]|jgi:hypothetical protein|nr:hypothetical protein [Candidatus Woesearchaeota archaeon]MDP6647823.1 glycosyltransferase family 39 protein [Candidatus Woesearchaeota archaeon]|tara:strand:+ start:904 stop:2541 length:1638 start_codon:yes stop_codon:yes gene_type:complete
MKFKIRKLRKSRNLVLVFLFLIFLALRLFTSTPSHFIGGDDAKYLKLADNFPNHTLDNKSLFLLHGPGFPYAIHFLSYLSEDHIAGIVISLISSIVAFFVLYKLIMLVSKNYNLAIMTLVLFTLSVENIKFATLIHKESFMIMLFLLSIYFFLKGVLKDKRYYYFASFFGIVTALTTDHVLFLLASFVAAYAIFGNLKKIQKSAAIPIILTVLFYSLILFTRFSVYSSNVYYSTGVDGVIEKVSDFGVRQIFSPAYFPETIELVFSKSSLIVNVLFIFGYMFNIVPFVIPPGLDRSTVNTLFSDNLTSFFTSIKLIVYLALFLMFIIGIYYLLKDLKKKKFRNNPHLFFFLMFLLFIFPITQRITTIRFVLMATIPLFYFIALGAVKIKINRNFKINLLLLAVLILLLTPFYWIASNNHFVLSADKTIEASNTAAFLDTLPEEGVMSQVGYSPELNYQTDKRIITMPSDPSTLDRILKDFEISYILYGERYWEKFSDDNADRVFNYDTIEYVRENPQKFRLIKVIKEDYEVIGATDEISVYEVVS